jgi:hypothetical protein
MDKKKEAMKLLKNYFQLLAFNTIQFLDLIKDNKINDEKQKTNTPKHADSSIGIFSCRNIFKSQNIRKYELQSIMSVG